MTMVDAGYVRGMERLVAAVSELSLARDIESVQEIVRAAARQMTGADGATFILRDGEFCHYVDENAIGPLWKGRKFPMSACISGWTMTHRSSVVLPDIYRDPRIPVAAYQPTFVKSLAMVPIRTAAPIGAIGNYWADHHEAQPYEVSLLQALADSTSVALENIRSHHELESRVQQRTADLEAANRELEAFSYTVSHDLRSPLRALRGFSSLLVQQHSDRLGPEGTDLLDRVEQCAIRMDALIDDLLELARVSRTELVRERVDLTALARGILSDLSARDPCRRAALTVDEGLSADADVRLVRIALENLLGNAWKFTSHRAATEIHVGTDQNQPNTFFVADNGAGFEMSQVSRLFEPFQRLHSHDRFQGTGIGLATVQRAITRHGGRVWAQGIPERGATFFFTLRPSPHQTRSS